MPGFIMPATQQTLAYYYLNAQPDGRPCCCRYCNFAFYSETGSA